MLLGGGGPDGAVGLGVGSRVTAPYVYAAASVPLWPSGFVTTTLTVPASCCGTVSVIVVPSALTAMPVARTPPNPTVAPCWKAAPVAITGVPPLFEPDGG